MITYRKLDDQWAIQSDERLQLGQTVSVSLKNGGTKQAVVGDFAREQYGKFVYWIAATPRAERERIAVGNMTGVLALFDKARQHLKWPAIVLSVPAINETIRITVAGERAKVPGSLNVASYTHDDNYGKRFWYGRVLRDGNFEAKDGTHSAIAARLSDFACNPVKVATEHGRLTGRCCFCNTPLKDERSTAVGYGPICAGHYGLPWGARPVEFAAPVSGAREFDDSEELERDMQRMEAEAAVA